MARILLGVTGSVAATRTPLLYRALAELRHEVKVVATDAALYFFKRHELPPGSLFTDEDEWPRRPFDDVYQREDPVLHIELRRWADVLLIAPLDANTLAKLAVGLSDNCLTCVFRAWDLSKPVLLAPAMNTLMWNHPHTRRHFRSLAEIFGLPLQSGDLSIEGVIEAIDSTHSPLGIIAPIAKKLACGDTGVGAMEEVPQIAAAVQRLIFPSGGMVAS